MENEVVEKTLLVGYLNKTKVFIWDQEDITGYVIVSSDILGEDCFLIHGTQITRRKLETFKILKSDWDWGW